MFCFQQADSPASQCLSVTWRYACFSFTR